MGWKILRDQFCSVLDQMIIIIIIPAFNPNDKDKESLLNRITNNRMKLDLEKSNSNESPIPLVFIRNISLSFSREGTHHPGTSSGSSQAPLPSASPILKTVPMGQPYSRATPSMQM